MSLFLLLVACGPKPAPAAAAVEAPVTPAPAELPPAPVGGPWAAPLGHDHALIGRIWKVAERRWATEAELIDDLRAADFVMLGEKHDNPDHHRLQGRLIGALRPPAVAFEMLDHQDPVGLATDPAALAEAVAWDKSGWPAFAIYEPVFAAAYGAGSKVVPAHPTRAEVKSVMAGGFEALPEEARAGLALDRALSDGERASLSQEIVDGHCGQANEMVVEMMIRAQVLKDAWMGRAVAGAGKGAVLVAGNGHARGDRGVPHYLDGEVRSVSFLEVSTGDEDPAAYDAAADWVWFTARLDDEDPCAAYAEQLEKMKASAPAPAAE